MAALLFHVVATQIQALVVPWHQLLQSFVKEQSSQGIQPVVYFTFFHELLVGFKAPSSRPDRHLAEEMAVTWCQIQTVRRVAENLPVELLM